MTPNLSTAFYNYGQINARSVKTIMSRLKSEPIFADRLLSWLDDCSKFSLKALDPERAKVAMCDMVALRMSCYGFSVKDGKLKMTDLGGAGVCQTCCPPISCGVSDFRGADFGFWVEPDGSGGLPVAGFA